jgi:segregation and condensation protein B
MSLKAKLEAVIYAAEEPVTLAQMAMLFADEALEWKAEREAAAQAQAGEPAAAKAAALPLLNEAFRSLELELGAAETGEKAADESAGVDAGVTVGKETGVTEPQSDVTSAEATANAGAGAEAAAGADADGDAATEGEAKRLARLRDREARIVIQKLLDELIAEYAAEGRGIEIREIAGGYRMATKPECHDAVRSLVKSVKPALKLSLPALETLAVIAYKQPVTAPEVNEIRGVDSSAVFGTLLSRKLITTAGRKLVIGRPILYRTTREFLLRFGLKDVTELPSMDEFEKLAASELDEPELATSGASATEAAEFNPDPSLEVDGGPDVYGPASEEPEGKPDASSAPETAAKPPAS